MHKNFEQLELARKKLIYKRELIQAQIVNRPNRYVAIVRLKDGSVVKAHTPVGGRIGGLTIDGLSCLLSGPFENRATNYTVEAIEIGSQWIGINQTAANSYVKEFLSAGLLPKLAPQLKSANEKSLLHSERRLGQSRIDFFIESTKAERDLWIEVKTPLIKLHTEIPKSIPIKTDYKSDSVGNRMPKQITDLFAALTAGSRVSLLGVFLYKNLLETSDELRLKDNLNLEGLLTTGKALGLESWQLTLAIDPEGIQLQDYGQLI